MMPVNEAVAKIARLDDEAYFKRNKGKSFRLRPYKPGEKLSASRVMADDHRDACVLVFYVSKTVISLLITRPLPDEVSDPWLSIPGKRFRATDLARAYAMAARDSRAMGDTIIRGSLLEEMIPDRTEEYLSSRSPVMFLRDIERDMQAARLAGHRPNDDETGHLVDDALFGMCAAKYFADAGKSGDAWSMAMMGHFFAAWAHVDRPVFKPSRDLIEKLLNPDLVLDDAFPVIIPYSGMLVDVSELPDPFACNGESLMFAGLQQLAAPRDDNAAKELFGKAVRESLSPGNNKPWLSREEVDRFRPLAVALSDEKRIRYVNIASNASSFVFNHKTPSAPKTWSVWRASAFEFDKHNPECSSLVRLVSGLCYVLARGARERLMSPTRPIASHEEPIVTNRVRYYAVDNDVPLEISPFPIVKEVSNPSGPINKEKYVLTKTTRAAYAATYWTGKDRSVPVRKVVPEGATTRWMSVSTILGQGGKLP